MSISILTKTLSFTLGASALVGATFASPARATTLTGYTTNGADMAGMKVTVNFLGGGSETQTWAATGSNSGAALGADWSLSQSKTTFGNPWSFNYTGLDAITSLIIDAVPGNTVFDIGTNPSTPGSASGWSFSAQGGLAPSSYNYSVPIDISTGDLFGKLSLFWDNGFGTNDSLRFIADTDSGTIDDPVKPKDVPEPASVLGLLAVGALGAGSLKRKKQGERSSAEN